MPDKFEKLKESASIVTRLVRRKGNATSKHVTLRTERSELETDNKRLKTALSISEN